MKLFSSFVLTVGALSLVAFAPAMKADSITYVNGTPAYGGYPTSDATDTGAGYLTTDYASDGGGVGTFLEYQLSGGAVNEIDVYDRTTSGGGNGSYVGGTTDFTTEFELIFSNNSDMSSPLATYTFSKSAPTNPTSPADFEFIGTFAPVNANYVEYEVLSTNGGVNPGVANIAFTSATPEPGSLALLGTGLVGVAGFVRRRVRMA